MATVSIQPAPIASHRAEHSGARREHGTLLCVALTCAAVLVHGYHPYAEDGGIYLTGIKYLLNRNLYPYATGFVTSHLTFSCFARIAEGLVRLTALDVMTVMFGLYAVSILLTLMGAWSVTSQLFSPAGRRWAVVMLASALTLPVAGTSLMLVDPYVSARSLVTPCMLFALSFALAAFHDREIGVRSRGNLLRCASACVVALLLHPLMAGYGIIIVLLFGIFTMRQPTVRAAAIVLFAIAAVGTAACLNQLGPVEPAGYPTIAQTRTYWFLSEWAWYEWLGLIFPLGILAWFGLRSRNTASQVLARAAAVAGLTGLLIALLFVHLHGISYCVARLQPLRIFQVVYLLMVLFLGASIGALRRKSVFAGAAICSVVSLALFATERSIYAHSGHLEVPWIQPANGWAQGFLWLRDHTPANAVVALDSKYISASGEDAQNFRAISERSTPPDFSKDGGIAAIKPQLTAEWLAGEPLQHGLDEATDAQRSLRLARENVHWIVLEQSAKTAFHCPYRNASVSICEVPVP